MKDVQNHQSRWFSLYDEVIEYINKREELRKAYDHYEEKLENIANNKEEDITYIERVT